MVVSSAIRLISKEAPSSIEVVAVDEAELLIVRNAKIPRAQNHSADQLKARIYDTFGGLELGLRTATDSTKDANSMEEAAFFGQQHKTIQFADPLVTRSWEVPRIAKDDKEALFYSRRDIAKFRREYRTKFGKDRKYDRVFCEKLVESLDQLGANNYTKGDLSGALEAFNHALRVRSQTHVDFDPKTTCRNIHCIADIYSKQRNWSRALEAYRAALHAIRSSKDADVHKIVASLERKVALVENQMEGSVKEVSLQRSMVGV